MSIPSLKGLATKSAGTHDAHIAFLNKELALVDDSLQVGVLGEHMSLYILGSNRFVMTFNTMAKILSNPGIRR